MAAPTIHDETATLSTERVALSNTAARIGASTDLPRRGSNCELVLSRPDHETTVLHVAGEVDAATAPRLAELIEPRLVSTIRTLVVDLSQVSFLGTAGLDVLVQASLRATEQSMTLQLVTGPRCVDRAFRAGGLLTQHIETSLGSEDETSGPSATRVV